MTRPRTYVDVSVATNGTIVCSPDPVPVRQADSVLTFRLVTPGFAFPDDNAIVVQQPGAEFPLPSRTVRPTIATLRDLDRQTGSYNYNVNVVEQHSGRVIKGDPTIDNQPE